MTKGIAVVAVVGVAGVAYALGTMVSRGSSGKGDGKTVAATKSPEAGDVERFRVPLEGPSKGPATAKVNIVEFSDFQCPFCSRVVPTVEQIEKAYPNDVRVFFRHNPLPFHPNAPLAAEAGVAAPHQGKFWQMHDKMLANHPNILPPPPHNYPPPIPLAPP